MTDAENTSRVTHSRTRVVAAQDVRAGDRLDNHGALSDVLSASTDSEGITTLELQVWPHLITDPADDGRRTLTVHATAGYRTNVKLEG